MWLLVVAHQRQTWGCFFDLWEEDVTMDVPWCTLVPLLPPGAEKCSASTWVLMHTKVDLQSWSSSLRSYLFWQSSTSGSLASTRRSTSFTDSSSHSITAASLHRLQVLPTYSAVSSASAGGCLETWGEVGRMTVKFSPKWGGNKLWRDLKLWHGVLITQKGQIFWINNWKMITDLYFVYL